MTDLDIYATRPRHFRNKRTYTLQHALSRLASNGFSFRVNTAFPDNMPLAPVAFMHIDLTILPEAFRKIGAHYSRCINANAVNIAKPQYSKVIISDRNADVSGPVIVKSVLNHKGIPEIVLAALRGHFGPPHDVNVNMLVQRFAPDYRVYPSVQDIPPEVWENKALIVERFIPGRMQGPITKYRHDFFFDTQLTTRGVFDSLLCEPDSLKQLDFIDEVPQQVEEVKSQLGLDFGAIDYFITDDGVFIIDANKTTTLTSEWIAEHAEIRRFVDDVADTLKQMARE